MKDSRINKGIFNFLAKQGYQLDQMRILLHMFGREIGKNRPKRGRLEWYIEISNDAAADFPAFKKFFNKNKANLVKAQSYSDWWQEANMDGSFAYNGVTEDF